MTADDLGREAAVGAVARACGAPLPAEVWQRARALRAQLDAQERRLRRLEGTAREALSQIRSTIAGAT